MGNLLQACTDPDGEGKKRSAFEATNASLSAYGQRDKKVDGSNNDPNHPDALDHHLSEDKHGKNLQTNNKLIDLQQQQQNEKEEAERQRLFREEQARLKLIVSTADRDMISINPNKGLAGGGSGGGMNSHVQGAGIGNGRHVRYYDPAYAAAEAQDLLQSGGGGGGLHALFLEMEMKESALLQREEEDKQFRNLVPSSGERSMISMVGGRIPNTALGDSSSVVEALSKNHVWTKSSSHHHNIEASEKMTALWNWRRQLQLDDSSHDTLNSLTSGDNISSGIPPSANSEIASAATGMDLKFYFDDCAEKFVGSILPSKESLFQGLKPICENLP